MSGPRMLCAQIGATTQPLPNAVGIMCVLYRNRGALQTVRELGEQLYQLAQHAGAPTDRLEAHEVLGLTLFLLGDLHRRLAAPRTGDRPRRPGGAAGPGAPP